jgi:hypothetical protein
MNNVKSLPETECKDLVLRSTELQNIQSNQSSTMDLLNLLDRSLFPHPCGWQDGIIRPLLASVGNHLRKHGVAQENVRAGLIIYTAMNSVRLGYPLSVILIPDDYETAINLLSTCENIAPSDALQIIQELKAEHLYSHQPSYAKKVLICHDTAAIKKAMPDLLNLITTGKTARQYDSKSKAGSSIQNWTAQYPIALIGIERSGEKECLIDHPSILRIPVSIGCYSNNPISYPDSGAMPEDKRRERRTVAAMFERLTPRHVLIPYMDQITASILAQKTDKARDKINIIRNLVSICSIINDPPPVSPREIADGLIGLDRRGGSQDQNLVLSARNVFPVNGKPVEASKLDYYVSSKLLNGVISKDPYSVTSFQKRVFDTVKLINVSKYGLLHASNDIVPMLVNLHRIPQHWAYMHDIMGVLNKKTNFFVSIPEIENALGELKRLKVIGVHSGDTDKGRGYFILRIDVASYLELPPISKISHPLFQEESMAVMNPITGDIEKI